MSGADRSVLVGKNFQEVPYSCFCLQSVRGKAPSHFYRPVSLGKVVGHVGTPSKPADKGDVIQADFQDQHLLMALMSVSVFLRCSGFLEFFWRELAGQVNCSLLFNLHRPVILKIFFTFNYLFWSGLFSSCSKWELLSSCSAWASHCCGVSCCRAGALGCLGLISGPGRCHMP